jgi:hypothetical protein
VQCICKVRLRAGGSKGAQTSSDEGSEAEVQGEEEESSPLALVKRRRADRYAGG